MNKENYFISQFENKHIGDDGALVDTINAPLVYSKDAFFENVHFKTTWMTYYDIARKSMLINISDAIAMNASPRYALLSVAMPKSITKVQMQELANGFKDVAKEFDIEIIGGDTISNIKLDITITIVSTTQKPLKRDGLRNNYFLAYTGTIGSSAKELQKLFNNGSIHKKSKFIDIKLRKDFVSKSARFLSSGMDISDGLFSDLDKLSSVNNIGFKFHKKIAKKIACSGEEYEMLIAFDKRNLKAVKRIAIQSRTKLNIFATSARVKYINRCKVHHF